MGNNRRSCMVAISGWRVPNVLRESRTRATMWSGAFSQKARIPLAFEPLRHCRPPRRCRCRDHLPKNSWTVRLLKVCTYPELIPSRFSRDRAPVRSRRAARPPEYIAPRLRSSGARQLQVRVIRFRRTRLAVRAPGEGSKREEREQTRLSSYGVVVIGITPCACEGTRQQPHIPRHSNILCGF